MKKYFIPSTQVESVKACSLMTVGEMSIKGGGPGWNPLDPGSGDVG